MNHRHLRALSMGVVVVAATAALPGCPTNGVRDAIGQPCVVDGPPCAPDHVCQADGLAEGFCAPIDDYGATCPEPGYPQAPGKVRTESLDVNAAGDLGFLRDVVRVEGDLFIDGAFGQGALALGTLCDVAGLQQVTGSLLVAQTDLTTLDGLQSVSFVGAGIGVAGNPDLVDLDALANVVRVVAPEGSTFEIVIANNAALSTAALQRFLDVMADRPSIRIVACGNIRAVGLGASPCPADVDNLLRR